MSITSFDISKDMNNAATPLPPPPEAPESLPLQDTPAPAVPWTAEQVQIVFSEIHVHLQLFQTLPIVSLQRG